LTEADLFSFVMTESLTVSLYSIAMLFAALAWKCMSNRYWALAGLVLGLLCLTRPSFVILIPVLVILIAWRGRQPATGGARSRWGGNLAFAPATILVVGPRIIPHHISLGKWGLTGQYC